AKDKAGLGYDSQIIESEVVHSVFNSRESDVENSPVNDKFKTGEGFHAVSPPYTGNYMPSRPNLSFTGLDDYVYKTKVSETETSISKTSKDIIEKPKTVRPSAPIIEDWDTDSDNDSVFRPKTDQIKPKFTKINFVKSDENVKFVNKENTHKKVEYPRKSQSPREKPVLNNKGRVTSQREIRSVWNNVQRVNHQNKLTHPHPKRNFVPTTIATKSGQVPVNTAKQSSPRATTSISTTRVNNVTTARPKAVVSVAKGNGENVVKSSACWIWRPKRNVIDHTSKDNGSYMLKRFDDGNPQYTLQDQGIFDSGCSRHLTRNKSFLTDYQEIDGGFVAFAGIPKGDTVMLDSKDSTVTYTAVSSLFGGLSDIGSTGALPSPDYVSGPEYPPLPDFVPEPIYPEFMPPEDESDPEEDPNEDDDEDPEEDPTDYLADGGGDGDDEDESSDDDEDDDVDIKEDEEEEHLTPVDSIAVTLPVVDHAPSAEETEPFETDESATTPPSHPAYRVTTRILIRDEPPIPFWSNTKVARLLAIPTLPPSPLSICPTYPLGYQATMIRLRVETLSTSHSPPPHIILSHTRADIPPSGTSPLRTPPLLPIPLPASSLSLLLPSTDHGANKPEVYLPPRKRLCVAFGPRYEVGESSSAAAARPTRAFRADYGFVATMDREIRRDLERDVSYGITDTWDEMLVDMPGEPPTDDTELGRRMTKFTTKVRQETYDIYMRLDDEQTERQLMAGRLNMLYRDRRVHARIALLMERERLGCLERLGGDP
ncbi:hypothetical protein Tco_1329530, partial [Tanacetum coccineum]